MATQPPPNLPLFYGDLQPLSSNLHGNLKSRAADKAPFLATAHAIPLTVDEFMSAQRFYPIVFSVGENAVPLGLMGLNEGVNVFVDKDGGLIGETYVPAYVRRYPFMLARLSPDAQEMSLCYDPSSDLVGEFDEGFALFDGDKPSETTNGILKFCEEFEMSAQRTIAFMKELNQSGLLMEGEVAIQVPGTDQPFIYRGFQMVNEEKFRDVSGDDLRRMHENGMLPLIVAHLFSMSLVREIFAKQVQQGKGPDMPAAGLGTAAPAGTA